MRKSLNQANSFTSGFLVTQTIAPSVSQNDLTDVGIFAESASHFGMFGQAGNVYEWNARQGSVSQLSLRGGCWVSNDLGGPAQALFLQCLLVCIVCSGWILEKLCVFPSPCRHARRHPGFADSPDSVPRNGSAALLSLRLTPPPANRWASSAPVLPPFAIAAGAAGVR
jgi:hypothetical protein